MPKDKKFSKDEVALALRVFRSFVEEQVCIVVADEFYDWCKEQLKGGKDASKRNGG